MKVLVKYFLAIVFGFFITTAWAGDVEDADVALERNDYVTAVKKYRLAADKNDAYAQLQVGTMYDHGQGVAQDYAEAARWYKLAAAQGNSTAQFNIGVMYNYGQGVLQDFTEAIRWYKLAAAQGSANAQNNLAVMYFKGQGVIQNYVISHMWFNLASLKIQGKSASARDSITTLMTPQQIAEAQKLARECQARNFKNCD